MSLPREKALKLLLALNSAERVRDNPRQELLVTLLEPQA